MEKINFESFKSLSEEEKKSIMGGTANSLTCNFILREIDTLKREIAIVESRSTVVDKASSLQQQLTTLEYQYQRCINPDGITA